MITIGRPRAPYDGDDVVDPRLIQDSFATRSRFTIFSYLFHIVIYLSFHQSTFIWDSSSYPRTRSPDTNIATHDTRHYFFLGSSPSLSLFFSVRVLHIRTRFIIPVLAFSLATMHFLIPKFRTTQSRILSTYLLYIQVALYHHFPQTLPAQHSIHHSPPSPCVIVLCTLTLLALT